jgi:hypothetical protein
MLFFKFKLSKARTYAYKNIIELKLLLLHNEPRLISSNSSLIYAIKSYSIIINYISKFKKKILLNSKSFIPIIAGIRAQTAV